jgi:hypothetical protein
VLTGESAPKSIVFHLVRNIAIVIVIVIAIAIAIAIAVNQGLSIT